MSDPHHNLWAGAPMTPRLPSLDRSSVITVFDILRFAVGFVGLIAAAGTVAALLLGAELAQLQDLANADPILALQVLGAFYLGLAIVVLASVKWGRASVWTPLRLDVGAGKWLILGPLLALAASAALDLGAVHLYEWVTGEKLDLEIDQFVRNATASPQITAATVLVAGLIGPIVEELIFRGLFLGWLQRLMPFWLAALISSALFGLAHVQGAHAILAGLLGLVFAYLYRRAGSLWAPIAAHIANNVLAVVSVYAGL